jgi:regulator of nonsense transcripts 1
MILSPYNKAVNRYQGATDRLPLTGHETESKVRTIDTAQGQEADVVFLDMVRSRANSHNGNPKRLASLLLARDGPKSL